MIARALVLIVLVAAPAHAQRPVLAGELAYGEPGGELLVHYATTGVDAVPALDEDGDGVPDFVAEVAATTEAAHDRFVALGFRRPLADTLGGDPRIDIYLRDLVAADGNTSFDRCVGEHCIGYIVAENDFAGFAYPSIGEGLRSVLPHELFHLVQHAYSASQPATWTEGTAVWAVEHLYGEGNADFERFLPSFITRSYRPFERPSGGFGDAYPYGAALWPYYLELRFGIELVVASWAACEGTFFLDAIETVLASHGLTLDDAWTEFTRWNLFVGPRTLFDGYPPGARGWAEVPREPAIEAAGRIYLEGLSARYVPIVAAERSRIEVAPSGGIRTRAWLVHDGGGLAEGVELAPEAATLVATIDAGAYTLVLTGLSRGTITTAVEVSLTEPPADPSGCTSATGSSGPVMIFTMLISVCGRRASRRRARRALGRHPSAGNNNQAVTPRRLASARRHDPYPLHTTSAQAVRATASTVSAGTCLRGSRSRTIS